jgi:dipeptidase E
MKPTLLLISTSTVHGTGYLEHCQAEMLAVLGSRRRVAFVPYALFDRDRYAATARAVFERMGCMFVSVHSAKDPVREIAGVDAVFVGGGNTFRLLDALYGTGLLAAIRARVAAGMVYMGASAGSNVAGLSIRTTNDMPIVYPPSFDALGLVSFNLNPHYLDPDPDSKHMGETREQRIKEFHEENDPPVLGLREGAMLRVENGRAQLRGTRGGRVFRKAQPAREVESGADVTELLA